MSSTLALEDINTATTTVMTLTNITQVQSQTESLNLVTNFSCLLVNSSTSCLAEAPRFQESSFVRVIVLVCIGVVSLVGNCATLASICRARKRRSSTVYFLIGHLAIADILVSVFCVLAEAAWTYSVAWKADDVTCKAVKFVQMFGLYLSTFILVVIGFDRFAAVRFPLNRNRANVRRMVIVAWTLSAVFSSPQTYIFRVERGPFREDFYQCVTYGAYDAPWQQQLYTTLTLILLFLIPLTTLVVTYACTFYTIAKREKRTVSVHQLPPGPTVPPSHRVMDKQGARRRLLHRAKVKTLMITVVIVLTFVICWTPYYVMMIIFIFLDPDEQLSEDLKATIFFFGASTALVNPLIYGAFHLKKAGHRRPSRTGQATLTTSCKEPNRCVLKMLNRGFNQARTSSATSRNVTEPLHQSKSTVLLNDITTSIDDMDENTV